MRFLDRAFAITIAIFVLGSFAGALIVILVPPIQALMLSILHVRMLAPLQTVSKFGKGATWIFIFVNNGVPLLLSYLYPFIIMKVEWTPPMSSERRGFIMGSFTALCAFLIGAFNLGAVLVVGWKIGGASLLLHLLSTSSIHGPLEFLFVLLCVAEPLRISWFSEADDLERARARLRDDTALLFVCLVGLFVSAIVEVFLLL
jgi:hypothetical protein